MQKIIKYKISYIKKNKYVVLKTTEDGEELFIERVFEGNINECSEYIKEQKKS